MWSLVSRFWRLTCVKLRVSESVSRDLKWSIRCSHIKDIYLLKEDHIQCYSIVKMQYIIYRIAKGLIFNMPFHGKCIVSGFSEVRNLIHTFLNNL